MDRKPLLAGLGHTLHHVLTRSSTRLALSLLILLSICPFPSVARLWWLFFAIFAVEFAARIGALVLVRYRELTGRERALELGLAFVDFIALASFLPVFQLAHVRFLRLFRFARLAALMSYWGPTFRILWSVLNREERTRQLRLLVFTVAGLSVISAAMVWEFSDPEVRAAIGLSEAHGFSDVLWWTFRQLQDPGNLLSDLRSGVLVVLSVSLTTTGLLLLSFLVGLGTDVVGELIQATREEPLGYRGHSVLINVGEHTHFFFDQMVAYHHKDVRPPAWIALGEGEHHRETLSDPRYRRIRYRRGSAHHPEDLAKADVRTADRVVVLANEGLRDPDPDTVGAVLSARQSNPRAVIFAEVYDEKNASAVLAAGGLERTVVVPTEHLISLALANLVAHPVHYPLMEELFTVRGNEIYTVLYGESGRPLPPLPPDQATYDRLVRWAYETQGCVLVGLATPHESARQPSSRLFHLWFAPRLDDPGARETHVRVPQLKGYIAVASGLSPLRRAVESFDPARAVAPDPPTWRWSLPDMHPPNGEELAKHVLFCGFRQRSAQVLEHLTQFLPDARFFVVVRDESSREKAGRALTELGWHLTEYEQPDGYEPGPRGTFERVGPWQYAYHYPDGRLAPGRVHLLVGDWSSRTYLLNEHDAGFDLFGTDLVFVQSEPQKAGDPDARTVLALMKLQELRRSPRYRERFAPHLRVIAEINDPLKAEILESRFGSEASLLPVQVISTERLRNALLFQSTVIPGFGPAFMRLFAYDGPGVQRYETSWPAGTAGEVLTFGALLRRLYDDSGRLLVAVELSPLGDPGDDPEVHICPSPGSDAASFPLSRLRAVFVLERSSA